MKLTTTVVAAASLLGASAQAQDLTLGLMALRSLSPIHFGSINAADAKFWIWGPGPKTDCPPEVRPCTKTNSTQIDLYTGNGAVGLVCFIISFKKDTVANRYNF